jgi:hypothetical protein
MVILANGDLLGELGLPSLLMLLSANCYLLRRVGYCMCQFCYVCVVCLVSMLVNQVLRLVAGTYSLDKCEEIY